MNCCPRQSVQVWRKQRNVADGFETVFWEIAQASVTQAQRGLRNAYWYRNDNRNQQHYFHWPSFQRRVRLEKPLGWGELAGARNWHQIVASCSPQQVFASSLLNSGVATEIADQGPMHAVVLTTYDRSAQTATKRLLETLGEDDDHFRVLIAGPIDAGIKKTPKGAYLTGELPNLRPLLTASQLVIIPAFDEQGGRALFHHFVTAAGYGRPMVVGAAVATTLRELGVQVDLSGLPNCQRPQDVWPMLQRLISLPQFRLEVAAISARIGEQLRAAGVLHGPSTVSKPDLIWEPEIAGINKTLDRILRNEGDTRANIDRLVKIFRLSDASRAKMEAVLRALFIDRDAPILETNQPISRLLLQLRPVSSPAAALAMVFAADDKGAGRSLVSSGAPLNESTLWRVGSPLDKWRRGEDQQIPVVRLRGPQQVIALVYPENEPSKNVRDLLETVAKAGVEVRSNVAQNLLLPVGSNESLSSAATLQTAMIQADLILCLGSAEAEFSFDSLRLSLAAMRAGRPLLGNRAMIWYVQDPNASFISDDCGSLAVKASEILSDPSARAKNILEVAQSFFGGCPWIVARPKSDEPSEYSRDLVRGALRRVTHGEPILPSDLRRLPLFVSELGDYASIVAHDEPIVNGAAGPGGLLSNSQIAINLRAILRPQAMTDSHAALVVSPAMTVEGLNSSGEVVGRRRGVGAPSGEEPWLLRRSDLDNAAKVRITLRGLEDEAGGKLPVSLRGFYEKEQHIQEPPCCWTGPSSRISDRAADCTDSAGSS